MKFTVGDKILLKQTGEEGYVTAYINDDMFEVEVRGITFPVYKEEIDHPYLKWFTEKKKEKKQSIPEQLPTESEKFRKPKLAKGVYLSFLPVFKIEEMEDIVDHFKIYLLNELPIPVQFSYTVRLANKNEFSHEGRLHAFGHLYLHNVDFLNMSDQPRFHWQLSDTDNPELAAEGILRIRPAKLFEHISDVLHKNEPTYSYLLAKELLPKKKEPKPEKFEPIPKLPVINTVTKSSVSIESPRYELDLHIEQLIDDIKGLNNAEIMQIQLNTLQRFLYLAIAHRQERMIVIHGLGKGTLREAVHKMLKQTPEVARYKNEWSGKYGFGATEVFFKR